jgi:hypothetical protein
MYPQANLSTPVPVAKKGRKKYELHILGLGGRTHRKMPLTLCYAR